MTKIFIIVKGGLVTGVWSTDPSTQIEIKDFDNEPGENWQAEDEEIDKLSKGMTAIY